MTLIVILLSLGVMSGFLAGLFGIGGSMIMVPFLVPLFDHMNLFGDSTIKFAIASAMAVVCFTSLSSMRAHHARGAINWRLAAIFTIGILPGGLLASLGVFGFLKSSWLYFLFGGLVILSGLQMWRGHHAKPIGKKFNPKDTLTLLPTSPWLVAFGVVVGFLSGLVGAGGGFLMVPFQTHFGIPVNRAVANSSATGFPIAAVNSIGFLLADNGGLSGGMGGGVGLLQTIGFVHWPTVFIIAMTSVLFAPLGAWLAHSLPLRTLRRVFSIFLFLMAGYMLWRGYQL
ncbi:MAG: sulfite exporter TauE/SafE family protein [Hydrotalea sp.]|nr:sulfite exporter TauE/SafE family protein [Hydrotalea sp.]